MDINKYDLVDVKKLKPYKNNARTHSDEQIKQIQASIREFGFVNPVLIDGKFNIIAGHGRVMAAKNEGMEKVPCIFIEHLTEAQQKAYIIADNKLAENAGWDTNLLKIELDELQELNFDLDIIGFDSYEIEALNETEKEIEIREIEIQPFIKIHYLITADLNLNDYILEALEELKKIGGVEIESSLN